MGGMHFVGTAWADQPEAIQLAVTGTHVTAPDANYLDSTLWVAAGGESARTGCVCVCVSPSGGKTFFLHAAGGVCRP